MKKRIISLFLITLIAGEPLLFAQGLPTIGQPRPAAGEEKLFSQNFVDAPLEMLVDFYNDWAGRTLIIQADLSKTITLKFSKLTKEESMIAIETVLSMNDVALIPMGEKFLKVVPIGNAQKEGIEATMFNPEDTYVPADKLMSQIIPLRYVVFSDVQEIVQHLMHAYGTVKYLERTNSILITDTSLNISRIVETLDLLDQPLEQIEPRIYQLNYCKAGDIAAKLKELVEAAQADASSSQTTRTTTTAPARTIPGVVRAPRTTTTAVPTGPQDDSQMIQGNVKFVSDDRTNILIVFSKKANFDFFDRIIKVLDVPVDPEVVVETINLEYAEAKDIAAVLNDFIGAAKAEEETTKAQTGGDTGETGQSRSISDVIAQRTGSTKAVSAETASAIGRLSEDTKILSDERTNSLLLMGSKGDIEALKAVIAKLDIMLQQVMIEAVIMNVDVGDSFATGVDWVYEKGIALSKERTFGTALGNVISTNALSLVSESTLSYFETIPNLDMQVIISAAKSDSDARILSTPVVMTTDNTEAKITVADERPVITSSTGATSGYSARSTYQYKTIGVELTVTPHINPQNFVLMEIKQSADDLGKDVKIDENDVPTIQKREITATVGVRNKETIILGGLVRKNSEESASKIPLLGDIPLLGRLFRSQTQGSERNELVVLLTPYVLNTPEEARAETLRRVENTASQDTKWPRGWSLSELANDEEDEDAWKTRDDEEEDPEIWRDWD